MRKKLHRILDLVLDLNEQGNHSFINLFGHTGDVRVEVYDGKWEFEKESILTEERNITIKADEDEDTQEVKQYTLAQLDELINKLEELKVNI